MRRLVYPVTSFGPHKGSDWALFAAVPPTLFWPHRHPSQLPVFGMDCSSSLSTRSRIGLASWCAPRLFSSEFVPGRVCFSVSPGAAVSRVLHSSCAVGGAGGLCCFLCLQITRPVRGGLGGVLLPVLCGAGKWGLGGAGGARQGYACTLTTEHTTVIDHVVFVYIVHVESRRWKIGEREARTPKGAIFATNCF